MRFRFLRLRYFAIFEKPRNHLKLFFCNLQLLLLWFPLSLFVHLSLSIASVLTLSIAILHPSSFYSAFSLSVPYLCTSVSIFLFFFSAYFLAVFSLSVFPKLFLLHSIHAWLSSSLSFSLFEPFSISFFAKLFYFCLC